MLPSLAAVGGLVNSVSGREIGPAQSFSAAHINNFGIGWRNRQRANRACGLPVENRQPSLALVGGFPNAAVVYAYVEDVGLAGNAANGNRAPAAKRPNHPPAHLRVEIGIKLLCSSGRDQ